MTKNKGFQPKRLLKIFGLVILVLIVLLYLVLPVGIGIVALFPVKESVGTPPQGFEEVTLTAEDGIELKAWYRPAANGAAILLFHGAGDSREGVRGYAEMLARDGFGVLALDQRGHGESQGKTNRLGWQGTLDVGAALRFLKTRPAMERQSIGALGLSMGGEVLLGAAAQYPEIRLIAADGATHRSIDELMVLESERPLVRNFTARVMFAAVRLFSAQMPPKPFLESMRESGQTRFLLIAGGGEAQEIAYNQLFRNTLGERASLWIAPDAGHIQAFSLHPVEYEQKIVEFFQPSFP